MVSNQVFVSVENLAPDRGTALTPVWVGFHNGEFDTYDRGRPASPGLESLAEDGNVAEISREFDLANFGETQGAVGEAPIQPGDTAGELFSVDSQEGGERYLNYAAMILPSNDFFIANGNPLAHEIFDENGNFIGADFIVQGSAVLDAGTEVNDEIPENTAFFGQSQPNTGDVEGGVIQSAEGFIEGGNILSSENFSNADFTAEGYDVARIRVLNAIVGDESDETIRGTSADDYISGLGGDDRLIGRAGNDIITGGDGNDYLAGRVGDDKLEGGIGDDTLIGGAGNDYLAGNEGNNLLRGGAGDDIYALDTNGLATIQGFGAGDRLQLGAGLQFEDLAFEQSNRNAVISVGEDAIAILRRTSVESLSADSFL